MSHVPYKDMKAVAADLKIIYRALSIEQAEEALDAVCHLIEDKFDEGE